MKKLLLFIFLFAPFWVAAQVGVGQWRDHLPYGNCIDVCEGNGVIYAATPFSVFFFDLEDFSTNRISKVNGLAESEVSSIAFNSEQNALVVGYVNGNIDLIFNESQIVNLRDLKNSNIPGDKRINAIAFKDGFAYLGCGFGIVVVDIEKNEIKETYLIGENSSYVNVQDLVLIDGFWHAATDNGIYRADASSPFLVLFSTWEKMDSLPDNTGNYTNIELNDYRIYLFMEPDSVFPEIYFRERLEGADWEAWTAYTESAYTDVYVDNESIVVQDFLQVHIYDINHNLDGSYWGMGGYPVRGNTCIRTDDGIFWMADQLNGLLGENFDGIGYHSEPDGPYRRDVRKMDAYNNNVWTAGGGVDASHTSLWQSNGVYGLVDEQWFSDNQFENEAPIKDIMDIAVNPTDNSEIFAASWHVGLVRIKDGEYTTVYDDSNSSLEIVSFEGQERIGVGALAYDTEGNLWFSAHRNEKVLHVLTNTGNFVPYDLAPFLDESDLILDILPSQRGYVYIVTDNSGMLVLDHKETISDPSDDALKLLSTEEGNGALPSSKVLCVEEDLDGEIWIGTPEGPAVLYSQESVFEEENNFDTQQIFITQDGNVQILLETETITAIELDGGNRKWVGTQNSGVYLLGPDGIEQIHHFTTENSPLLSNTINDIVINQESGEVFFGTDKGIIGFNSDATNFYEEMKDQIKVYPNPVRPEYEGLISIDNLSRDADIKIADISGNVIYQTTANGGRATWDGRSFDGRRVSTGVYIVFATTDDGSSKAVSRVVFIN